MANNPIVDKSFQFSVKIIMLCNHLSGVKKEFVLSKQLLRSGTSIGANVIEAQDAQSKKDFISKMSIALKEARETNYWLSLLTECGYVEPDMSLQTYRQAVFKPIELSAQTTELIRILTSIVKSSKE